MSATLTIYDTNDVEKNNEVQKMLNLFNSNVLDLSKMMKYKPLNIIVEINNTVAGGMIGHTAWGALTIKTLAIHESIRKQNLGSQILEEAEQEALKRGGNQIYTDSFSFQGHEFYLKHGFKIIGKQENFPPNETRFFLQKIIT